MRPPRFRLRTLLIAVAVGALFGGWVVGNERARVSHYREVAASEAALARRCPNPQQAAFHARLSRLAAARAGPWSQGWFGPQPAAALGIWVVAFLWWWVVRGLGPALRPVERREGPPGRRCGPGSSEPAPRAARMADTLDDLDRA